MDNDKDKKNLIDSTDDNDKYNDECGVFAIYDHEEAANLTYLGLYALQHRGQESAGIVTSDGQTLHSDKGMGLVADLFNEEDLKDLPGHAAIGHVRYSTQGESHIKNAQPFVVEYSRGPIAIAHNGNLVNASHLRDELEAYGSIFQSSMDTEVIVHLIASRTEQSLLERVTYALGRVKGAYSLAILTEKSLVVARDPNGFRPLCLGKLKDSYVVASETCALDLIDAEYVRDVEPGEVIIINDKGLQSYKPFEEQKHTPCIFEFVYFARPDSLIFGQNVYDIRKNMGRILAMEHHVDADLVIPVPDSGVAAAIGYAEVSGIPFQMGLVRNHYIGRTFIEPKETIRHFGVKIKLNAIKGLIKGKRVVVVDDSIVRGTTSRKIIKMIRAAGAKEVHMRVSSPRTMASCFYGIDTPNPEELIAANNTVEEINKYITADTLGYMSVEGLYKSVTENDNEGATFCDACFTGNYPVEIGKKKKAPQLVLFKS